jgi:glycine/D-amino acid oxidase-like deaminating enzyme
MKLMPYWLDTAPSVVGSEQGPVEGRAEIAIIGGGFTGLAAALALARQGGQVVVFDTALIGGGASGRNGGQCNNGLSLDFRSVVERFGLDRASAMYRAYDAAVDTVERIVTEEQIACDFRRTGKIKLAVKPVHYEKLARSQEILVRSADPDALLVSRDALGTEIGSERFHGALVLPKSAGMHMGKFVHGVAEAALRRGARIFENAAVTGLRRLNGRAYRLTTTRGTLDAQQVLVATGASLQGPFFHFRRRIVPVGSFIIATGPLPAATVDQLMPTRRMATDTRHVGCYFRITPDNRLLFGGRARFALSNPESDAKSGRILQRMMHAVFPQLQGVRIDYCWGGTVDLTADRLPRAGEHDGLYYAMGYSGHGTQMSTYMGTIMAEVIGGRPEANIWRELDWPAIPGHFGKPWFLPFVGAYYRWQDLMH